MEQQKLKVYIYLAEIVIIWNFCIGLYDYR